MFLDAAFQQVGEVPKAAGQAIQLGHHRPIGLMRLESSDAVVALDLSIDTSTPQGEAMANLLAVFAGWERRIIGQRTKDALAVKRVQGKRFGRPPMPPAVEQWIIKRYRTLGQQAGGKTWGVQTRIARELSKKANRRQGVLAASRRAAVTAVHRAQHHRSPQPTARQQCRVRARLNAVAYLATMEKLAVRG